MLTPSAYHVIISHGPQTIPNLEGGFMLRCFQHLSIPDLATLRCPWQDSRHTRGQFTPVLSSLNPLFPGAQTIPYSNYKIGMLHLTHTSRHFQRNDSSVYKSPPEAEVVTGSTFSCDFPRYYLKADFDLQTNCNIGPDVCNSKSKSYEGFTVMSNIFNRDYSRK